MARTIFASHGLEVGEIELSLPFVDDGALLAARAPENLVQRRVQQVGRGWLRAMSSCAPHRL